MRYLNPNSARGLVWSLALALSTGASLGCDDPEKRPVSIVKETAPRPVKLDPVSLASLASGADIVPNNAAPVIHSVRFEPDQPDAGDKMVRAVIDASDPEGSGVWFHYEWTLDGRELKGPDGSVVLLGATKGQLLELLVKASDGDRESTAYRLHARIANALPDLRSVTVTPAVDVIAGTPIVIRPDARDADGDRVEFQYRWWVNDLAAYETGPSFSTEALHRGDRIRASVVASDGEGESEPVETPLITITNTPPKIVSKPAGPGPDGAFRYQVSARDADGDRQFQFRLDEAPEGMEIEALTGLITWTPAPDQDGVHTISVIADDLQGGLGRQTFEATVSGSAAESSPAKVR